MIYTLIGHSSSGKSTIEKNLVQLGYPRIVSYTTRAMRESEKQDVDYHFIDYPTFEDMRIKGFFVETATYNGWHYGLSLNGIDYENTDYVAVVTIGGHKDIEKYVGVTNIRSIHIKVGEHERIKRQLNRGDNVEEVIRRVHNDLDDFEGIESICDYTVENINVMRATRDVESIIKSNW